MKNRELVQAGNAKPASHFVNISPSKQDCGGLHRRRMAGDPSEQRDVALMLALAYVLATETPA